MAEASARSRCRGQTLGGFSEREQALLKTFADQAVIAIQNARLFNETREALEQQTATAEILRVISESPTDVQPVFEAIVQSGVRLFEGASVAVSMPRDGQVCLMAIADGAAGRADKWRALFPFPLAREYVHGAALLDCRVIDIADALEPGGEFTLGKRHFSESGYRAMTVVPMVRGTTAIGAISVVRLAPGSLAPKQLALLQTFADQAVIAIENVRLFNETREALERQTATAEVLRVISASVTDDAAGVRCHRRARRAPDRRDARIRLPFRRRFDPHRERSRREPRRPRRRAQGISDATGRRLGHGPCRARWRGRQHRRRLFGYRRRLQDARGRPASPAIAQSSPSRCCASARSSARSR